VVLEIFKLELDLIHILALAVTNVVAKNIFAKTETGAPVAVMCNSTTVGLLSRPFPSV